MNNLLTVVVLTLNEEMNLSRCLKALPEGLKKVVLDSGSTDKTLEVAARCGASILTRNFDTFGSQRNWAMSHNSISSDWILFLDADEEVNPAFLQEIESVIASDESSDLAGAYCCWKMMLRGRWLKRSDHFPKWQMRLVNRNRMSFIDYGHGQKEGTLNGRTIYIQEPYLHHAFSKGWTDWLSRHNRYSSQEAVARIQSLPQSSWQQALRSTPSQRNQLLKPLVTQLPAWPFIRFVHAYILRGGVLEGREGLDYCLLMAIYEYLITLKIRDSGKTV